MQRLATAGVALLDCQGRDGEWDLKLLASDREGIAKIYDILTDLDCNADCRRVAVADEAPEPTGMSPLHYETLTTALERGYYNIHEISPQANSLMNSESLTRHSPNGSGVLTIP